MNNELLSIAPMLGVTNKYKIIKNLFILLIIIKNIELLTNLDFIDIYFVIFQNIQLYILK